MDMPKVPFEQVHPRETWPVEECERCGEPTVVRPDHPALMVPLCDACRTPGEISGAESTAQYSHPPQAVR